MRYMAVALILVTACCGVLGYLLYTQSHPREDPFLPVDAAVTDIAGAISVGVNYYQFSDKVQRLSTAILIAGQAGADPRRLRSYSNALAIYKDSLELWSDKVQQPDRYSLDIWGGRTEPVVLGQMMREYNVAHPPHDSLSNEPSFNCDRTMKIMWLQAGINVAMARQLGKD